ncbi:MAG: DUF2330 domain-containing protein [Polyangiaceae bacterium]
MKGIAWGVAALLGCVLLVWSAPSAACGMTWGTQLVPPKPADEQVLMTWDSKTQTEHFVRQVRFADAKDAFGFVVPTPTRPKLHEITQEPWKILEQRCNPRWSSGLGFGSGSGIGLGGIGTLGHGAGSGRGAGPPPVTVLEEKQLGDFKAFVLEANDASGFSAWLKKNAFKSTPELEAWLAHYIELKFYFVALRYAGAKQAKAKGSDASSDELISKTVHISFQTPNPFYPYLEPLAKERSDHLKERKLQVWFVSDQVMQPVARYAGQDNAPGVIVRPWSEALPCDGSTGLLAASLDGDLKSATAKRMRLQVFADLKTSREGYGDVLLVPMEPGECSGDCASQRERLVKVLEGSAELRRKPRPEPGAAPTPYLAPGGCGVVPRGNAAGWLWLGLSALILVGRRRRRSLMAATLLALSGLLLVGCEKSDPAGIATPSADAASSAAPSSTAALANTVPETKLELPRDDAQAHTKLVALLGGKLGALSIPVQATDARTGIGAVASDWLPKGMPSADALAIRCVAGPHVETLYRVEIDHDSPGTPIQVIGPISEPAKACIARAFRDALPKVPQTGTVRYGVGFGPNTPQQRELQKRFTHRIGSSRASGKATRIRMRDFKVAGRLPPEVVQRIQRQNYGRWRVCADRDKTLKQLTISYVIDAEGKVKNVRSKPDGGAAGVCIRKGFTALTFPQPEAGIVTVSQNLLFERPE